MNLRRAAFYLADSATGGLTHAHLRDVAFMQSGVDGGARLRRLLAAQLAYVKERVPFYSEFSGARALGDLPVTDKGTHLDHGDQMMSTEFVGRPVHIASTSGSTGVPFRVRQDPRKRRRAAAETMYFGALAGYEVGDRLYYLKIWSARNRRNSAVQWARNLVEVDVLSFDERKARAVLRSIGEARHQAAIIGYASALETMASALVQDAELARRLEGKVTALIAQSEPLSPAVKSELWRVLDCEPVSRYGLEELGIVGQQQMRGDGRFILNRASHVVEVLEQDSDAAVPPGKVGRIVVTDVINRAQPLIRFDTGDLGAWAEPEGDSGTLALSRIDGRRADQLFDVNDDPLSPLVAYSFWWKYPGLMQYQLVQRAKGAYLLRLKVNGEFRSETQLVADFKNAVGSTAYVEVEYATDGFVLGSGKRKAIVNEYARDRQTGAQNGA